MSKGDVIQYIATNSIVEDIVNNITKGSTDSTYQDLSQDIYISLYDKPEKVLVHLYETKSINFYITRMVINNVFSKNSPYYTKYKKFSSLSSELTYD